MIRPEENPRLCQLPRWDDMSIGTCPQHIAWSETWNDVVSCLRFTQIERVLAWGDSGGNGKCRFESSTRGIHVAGKSGDLLAKELLQVFCDIASRIAEGHSRLHGDAEGFFSRGRSGFDFNASIDLRDGVDIRLIAHVGAACGIVYLLTVVPPVGARGQSAR